MSTVSRLRYHPRPPSGRALSARERALARWFEGCPLATFGLLLARHPRYPVVEGGRRG